MTSHVSSCAKNVRPETPPAGTKVNIGCGGSRLEPGGLDANEEKSTA
jgi:hypothetical protein